MAGAPLIRIFVSSPSDVQEEREKARKVITYLQKRYGSEVRLQPILWEDLPLQPDSSFQQAIDVLLSDKGVDIAVFILWSRFGTEVVGPMKSDGTPYRSGTEREFDLLLSAREQTSRSARRPDILFYTRNDHEGFTRSLDASLHTESLRESIEQKKLVESFISETFRDRKERNFRAYHSYSAPCDFSSRLRIHLMELLDERLEVSDRAYWADNPYIGLRAFQAEHADIFIGREQEVDSLASLLRNRELDPKDKCAFACLVGASGSGKSSLIRAGLAPHLFEFPSENEPIGISWFFQSMTPSDLIPYPLERLVENLATIFPILTKAVKLTDLADLLGENPEIFVKTSLLPAIRASGNGNKSSKLLLFFDQFEEFFTSSNPNQHDFLEKIIIPFLAALAKSGSAWVIIALRSDFYANVQSLEGFIEIRGSHCFDLLSPSATAIRRIVTRPAALAGVKFEIIEPITGYSLADRIIEDLGQYSDALPLLQFALCELYERHENHTLTVQAYEDMGCLGGAIQKQAERTLLAGIGKGYSQKSIDQIFPYLFSKLFALDSSSGKEVAVRRIAQESEMIEDAPCPDTLKILLEKFTSARLLVTLEKQGKRSFAVAHEALLHNWPRLLELRERNEENIRRRARVERAFIAHSAQPDPSLLLPEGLPLNEACQIHDESPHLLTQAMRHYIRTSQQFHHRRRRRWQLSVILFLSILILLSVTISIVSRQNARIAESEKNAKDRANKLFGTAWQSIEMLQDEFNDQSLKAHQSNRLLSSQLRRRLFFDAKMLLKREPTNIDIIIFILELGVEEGNYLYSQGQYELASRFIFDAQQSISGVVRQELIKSQKTSEILAELAMEKARSLSMVEKSLAKKAQICIEAIDRIQELKLLHPKSWRLDYFVLRVENLKISISSKLEFGYLVLAEEFEKLADMHDDAYESQYWAAVCRWNLLRSNRIFDPEGDPAAIQATISQFAKYLESAKAALPMERVEAGEGFVRFLDYMIDRKFRGEGIVDEIQNVGVLFAESCSGQPVAFQISERLGRLKDKGKSEENQTYLQDLSGALGDVEALALRLRDLLSTFQSKDSPEESKIAALERIRVVILAGLVRSSHVQIEPVARSLVPELSWIEDTDLIDPFLSLLKRYIFLACTNIESDEMASKTLIILAIEIYFHHQIQNKNYSDIDEIWKCIANSNSESIFCSEEILSLADAYYPRILATDDYNLIQKFSNTVIKHLRLHLGNTEWDHRDSKDIKDPSFALLRSLIKDFKRIGCENDAFYLDSLNASLQELETSGPSYSKAPAWFFNRVRLGYSKDDLSLMMVPELANHAKKNGYNMKLWTPQFRSKIAEMYVNHFYKLYEISEPKTRLTNAEIVWLIENINRYLQGVEKNNLSNYELLALGVAHLEVARLNTFLGETKQAWQLLQAATPHFKKLLSEDESQMPIIANSLPVVIKTTCEFAKLKSAISQEMGDPGELKGILTDAQQLLLKHIHKSTENAFIVDHISPDVINMENYTHTMPSVDAWSELTSILIRTLRKEGDVVQARLIAAEALSIIERFKSVIFPDGGTEIDSVFDKMANIGITSLVLRILVKSEHRLVSCSKEIEIELGNQKLGNDLEKRALKLSEDFQRILHYEKSQKKKTNLKKSGGDDK